MSLYAFWVWVRDLENGDAEIKRMTNNGEVEACVIVPVQERMEVARALMRSDPAKRADVCRATDAPDTSDTNLMMESGLVASESIRAGDYCRITDGNRVRRLRDGDSLRVTDCMAAHDAKVGESMSVVSGRARVSVAIAERSRK